SEREQLAYERDRASGGIVDRDQLSSRGLARGPVEQPFAEPPDDLQEVVELVGNASGEAPHGFEPPRLARAVVHPLPAGAALPGVVEQDQRADQMPFSIPKRSRAQRDPDGS